MRAFLLAGLGMLLVGCGGDDSSADTGVRPDTRPPSDTGPDAPPVDSAVDAAVDAGPPIEPQVVIDTRCGLDFRWLPPDDVGHLVSFDTPHSSLTTGEASLIGLGLLTGSIMLRRSPRYSTLAHRMVYTTQDRGVAREATALVVFPEVSSGKTLPVILWHHGTTGISDECSPTYDIEDRSSAQYEVALVLSLLASYGYIIVAPDYLGQKSVGEPSPANHPYLVGEPTAIASLDALDAARELAAMLSTPRFGRVALYGASQGGHAAFFTALYAPHYAPDVDIGAAVYVIPPTDLSAHMSRGIQTLSPPSGNAVLWMAAANEWYQPGSGLSDVIMAPFDTQLPIDLESDCSPETFSGVSSTDEVFTDAVRAASSRGSVTGPSPWGCIAFEGSVNRTLLPPPSHPGLVIQGERDTLVDTAIERESFPELCAAGHNLSYLECTGAGHEEAFFYSIDNALDFIDAQLATPTTQACVVELAQTCASEFGG